MKLHIHELLESPSVRHSTVSVFRIFFRNACRCTADFWNVRHTPSIFGKITGLGLNKFQRSNSFPDFFLNACRY